jgi:ketosteroid isomerase-like protein
MSRENVEVVRRLQPGPEVDLAALLRDDASFRAFVEAVEAVFHPEFEAVAVGGRYLGLSGLRSAWLDWIEAWESYWVEVEDMIDAGDDVVVLVRDHGRRAGMDTEVSVRGASVWTVRDGKVRRAAFYPDRAHALEAVGLQE